MAIEGHTLRIFERIQNSLCSTADLARINDLKRPPGQALGFMSVKREKNEGPSSPIAS